ncbi:MAG TPA: TIM44-like domain-containing protein [Clostridia bacterium]|nr:TIM44-like domain-containing protein [Clostridia bacterium]
MKHKRFLRLFGIALAMLILFAFPALSLADAGNFSGDSDYGGGGDWGGSDWGSSSGGWGDDGYYVSGGGSDIGFLPVIVIIVIVIIFLSRFRKGMNNAAKGAGTVTAATPRASLMPVSKLLETDPEFSENELKEKIGNLYIKLQNAWQDKKWDPMRAHMTDQLYNQFARQLDELVRNHRTNYVERIAVLSVDLLGIAQDEVNDTLVARVKTRIVDYTVDDATGNVVSGSKTTERFMEYEWTLIRSHGAKTEHSDHPETVHCANCGAPLEISYSAKCEYCGAVTVNSQYDWVISSIKGISQRSA